MFSLNAKHLFLTYPQCSLSPQEALKELQASLATQEIVEYVISQEEHKDTGLHLHAYIHLKKKLSTSCPSRLDISGFHGNYQSAINRKSVINYVSKDGVYISNMDLLTLNSKTKSNSSTGSRKEIGKRIFEGEEMKDMLAEYPHLIFGYKRLKEDIKDLKEDMLPPKPPMPYWLPNPWGLLLPNKTNIKKRHYWIYSTIPSLGKTTYFARPLEVAYSARICAGDLTYWPCREGDTGIILDDYNTAKFKWDSLNQMADGTYGFRKFMGGVLRLAEPIIIVLSNQRIGDLYPHMHTFIESRFIEICVDLYKI